MPKHVFIFKDVLAKKILLTEPKIVDESLKIFTKLLEEESVAKKAESNSRNSFPFDEKDELVQKVGQNFSEQIGPQSLTLSS